MKQLKNGLFAFLILSNIFISKKQENQVNNKVLKGVVITTSLITAGYGTKKGYEYLTKNKDEELSTLENSKKLANSEENKLKKTYDIKLKDETIKLEKSLDNPIQPPKNLNPPKNKTTYIHNIDQGTINTIEKECQRVLNHTKTYNMDNIEDDIINFFKNYSSYQKKQYDMKIQDSESYESLRKKEILSANPNLTEEEVAKRIMEMNSMPELSETKLLIDQIVICKQIGHLISDKNISNKFDPEYDEAYSIKKEQIKPFYHEFPALLEDYNKHFNNPLPKDDLDKIDKVVSNLSRILTPEDNMIKAYNEYSDSYCSYETGEDNIKKNISFDLFLMKTCNKLKNK